MTTSRSRRRMMIRTALAVAIGFAGLVFLAVLSQVMADVSTGSETNDVFTEAAEIPPSLVDSVVWLPDDEASPRQLEPLTRSDVTATWLRAWSQVAILAETGKTDGIDIYFSNSALDALSRSAKDWEALPIHQIGHELQLSFYSEDGQVIGLTATKSKLLRTETVGGQREYFDAEESYESVLILEDGNWRIQHWVRRSASGQWAVGALPGASDDLRSGLAGPTISLSTPDDDESKAGEAPNSSTPDQLRFKLEQFETDLAGASSAGATAIRLDLDVESFGSDGVTGAELERLENVLDLASDYGLKVIVSLFDADNWPIPSTWDADVRQLESLIPTIGNHEAVALYELAHEPDQMVGKGMDEGIVDAWLAHTGRAVRALDSETPMMITWSNRDVAARAEIHGDVVGFRQSNPAFNHPDIVGHLSGDETDIVIVGSTLAAQNFPANRGWLSSTGATAAVLAFVGLGLLLWARHFVVPGFGHSSSRPH